MPVTLLKSYLCLAAAMVLVGVTVPASKAVLAWFPPVVSAGLRFAFIAALLLPVAWIHRRAMPPRSAWLSLLFFSLSGMVMFNIFLLYGLRETSAVTAGILTSTIPAVTALLAALMLGERLTATGLMAVGLAVAGIAALNLQSATAGGVDSLSGNALICGAVLSEALYGIYSRRLGDTLPPLLTVFLGNLLATVVMAPVVLAVAPPFDPAAVPLQGWLLLATASVAAGLVSMALWMRGIVHVPATRAGLFTGLIPAASVAAALAFLGEPFGWGHAIGLAAVLCSIVLGTAAKAA